MSTLWPELQSSANIPAWKRSLRDRPSAYLLGGQLIAMVLIPFLEDVQHGRVAISILGLIIALFGIATVRSTPALTWISALIAFPAVVLEIWSAIDQDNRFVFGAGSLMLCIFFFYVGYGLIAYMFADHWVTKDELFAVGAAFTVFVWAFAYLYLFVQTVVPESFTAFQGLGERSFHELLYLSTSNFTSCGLSDVVPVKPYGRAVAMLEQTSGVLYVAMVISRLVALTAMRRSNN